MIVKMNSFVVWIGIIIFAGALTAQAEETVYLEKTVVTATRTSVALKDAPGAITVITAEDIKDSASRDLLDILREIPGLSFAGQNVGGRKTITLRGMNNHHTLILIDGRRIAASNAAMGHSDFENRAGYL